MTKNEERILLLLLEKNRSLLEISEIINSRKKIERAGISIKCSHCGEKNLRYYQLNLKKSSSCNSKNNIFKYIENNHRVPNLRCSDCRKRLLKYNKKGKLLTNCKKENISEIPYEKRKYILANLKTNEIGKLKEKGLILDNYNKYCLSEKEFYTYIFSRIIHQLVDTPKKELEMRLGRNLKIGRALIKCFYLNYNVKLIPDGLKVNTIDGLVNNIISALLEFGFYDFSKLENSKNIKKINKEGRRDLKSLWFTLNMTDRDRSKLRKEAFYESISM